MQVRTITVNAANLTTAGRGIQGTGFPVVNQEPAGNNSMFGPECKVTISQEGRNLSRQQTVREEKDVLGAQGVVGYPAFSVFFSPEPQSMDDT